MSAGPLTALPGWWGKLPGTGDFSHRRLPEAVRARLDEWLQTELGALRRRHAVWQTAYLGAPLWQFAAGVGLLTQEAWLGVLMPSVDRVGRYFPLLIVQPVSELMAAGIGSQTWWAEATDAALQALKDDCGPQGLDDALMARFGAVSPRVPASDGIRAVEPGSSLWRSSAGTAAPLTCAGWPRDAHFDLLFDLAGLPATVGPVT
ncbi:type VI secretion system-associated protein TagF [Ottowia pentelensis]|uniref:Type VI secretion system-associated protein TagF n=1 Tax=Ottowia pentelensis TaxID=511108 RepID=A0ABV6PN19_9BURK